MLDATTAFIVDLFLLLVAAVLAGEVSVHLGQSALVGQLIAGVVLGPTLLGPYYGLTSLGAGLTAIETLAVIFILFMAGLEIVPASISEMEFGNVVLGIAAFAIPFTIAAELIGPVLHVGYPTTLYVALTLSISALPVMGIMLTELGLAKTRMGTWLMNAALVNELTAVSVFAVLLRLGSTPLSSAISVAIAATALALFITTFLAIHYLLLSLRRTRLWEKLASGFASTWRGRQGEFAVLMVMVVGATLYSQYLGLTYVVGAFYAGLLVTRESAGRDAHRSISRVFDTMTWGFFIPLFFAFVGASMNLRDLASTTLLLALVILLPVAILTKLGTGTGVAALFGWNRNDSLTIGYFLNSRGAVELAMAVILLDSGLISVGVFTLIAGIGLVTTILAPIGAVRVMLAEPERREELYRRVPTLRPGPSRRWYRPTTATPDPYEALLHYPGNGEPGDATDPSPEPPPRSAAPATSAPAPPPAGAQRRPPPLPERKEPLPSHEV